MSPRLAACLLLLWSATPASADWLGLQFQSPLTTAQDIREASGRGDIHGLPVRITGVVTHINPEQKDFWVQDDSAGIHVLPHDGAAALQQGDQVEIVGFADRGDFAPCIAAQKVTRLGPGEMPMPMPFDLSVEDARWLDAQWVQAWVVIRGAYTKAGTTRLDVFTSHGCGTLVVPGEQWALAAGSLRDVAVTVRGVCVPTFKNRLICGPPKIYLSSLPQVPLGTADVIGGPNATPRVIDHLLRFAPAPHPGIRRVKIAGVVTATPLPGVLVVQDQTGGAMVWTDDPGVAIPVGTAVEAFGLLRIDGHRVGLARAEVKSSTRPPSRPRWVPTHANWRPARGTPSSSSCRAGSKTCAWWGRGPPSRSPTARSASRHTCPARRVRIALRGWPSARRSRSRAFRLP